MCPNKKSSLHRYSPKLHIEIPKDFLRESEKKTRKNPAPPEKDRETKESEFGEQVAYLRQSQLDFKIYAGDLYFAEIKYDKASINSVESLIAGLSATLLKYSKKRAIISIESGNFNRFEERLFKRSYLDQVYSVQPYSERLDPYLAQLLPRAAANEKIPIEVDFFPNLERKHYKEATNAIRQFVGISDESFGKEADDVNNDVLLLEADVSEIKKISTGVATISKILLPPEIIMEPSGFDVTGIPESKIEPPESTSSINIIDSGLRREHPLIKKCLGATPDYSQITADCTDSRGHGTFVSGLACYGRELNVGHFKSKFFVNMAKVIDSPTTFSEIERAFPEIIDNLVQELKSHSRIFNMSFNFYPRSLYIPEHVAKLCEKIDELIRRYDLVFCISAGNIVKFRELYDQGYEYPEYYKYESSDVRVAPPANCCNAISVGSYVAKGKDNNEKCVAREGDVSPFSRCGPSTGLILKPEVVESGGNVFLNAGKPGATNDMKVCSLGFHGSQPALEYKIGTSFAAPIIAHLAANIIDKYQQVSANLVRALIVNSCTELGPRRSEYLAGIKKMNIYGFGTPDINRALHSYAYRVTLYHEDSVSVNKNHFISFYVPQELKGAVTSRRIIITLAYDPPIDRNFFEDDKLGAYTNVALKLTLYKGIKDKHNRISPNDFCIVKSRSNLDSAYKNSTIKNLVYEWHNNGFGKMWYVKIEPERNNITADFKQNYALVITIEAENESLDIYETVAERMNIHIREREREIVKI